jgi:hypothetical protein
MNKENLQDNDMSKESCGCGCNDEHENSCGCGCTDHNDEAIMVDLEDENGNTISCQVVDGFVFKEIEYAVVQNPNDNSVYLFKVVGEGETGELVIPDDEEFEEASKYYSSLED